ncbi:MAG: hypothetical protein WAU07_02925 [Microgenomates group bacterium]
MTRAKTISFTKFEIKNQTYHFDYFIDEKIYTITLSHNFPSPLSETAQKTALFNLGMCYLIDLAELLIPDKILINYSLTDLQLQFWKSLYQEVAKEKMYIYQLDLALLDAAWQINTEGQSFPIISIKNQKYRTLCVTGGKESLSLLKLLKDQDDLLLFFLNPESNIHRQKVFDRVKNQFIAVRTISNRPELIKELKQKYQTSFGSGVDMAHLVFNALFLGTKYVMIGNEYSSNYPNVMYQGYMINHQYIKSIHFAQKINRYIDECVTPDFEYYSPFFGLYELNIAKRFFADDEFLDVWTSCNHTTEDNNFCANCAKCAFTYIISLVYVSEAFVTRYFSRDLLQDVALFKPMQDFTGEKPLDCVGEKIEVWTILNILAERDEFKDKPVIRYFIEKIKPHIIQELPKFHKELYSIHTVPTQLPQDLQSLIEKVYR